MPSTGRLSEASIASENSLPKEPMSEMAMASTPAKGPSPTTFTQISAQTSVSTPRSVSKPRRAKKRRICETVVLRAAMRLSGKAMMAASMVPSRAMATVSPSARR